MKNKIKKTFNILLNIICLIIQAIDNMIVPIIIVSLIVILGILIYRIPNNVKQYNEISEVPVIRIKPENNKEKNSDDKEKFTDTSQDYLSEDYKKNLTEICKSTAPSKTYQAGGKNFVVIDRKVYRVTDEDHGLLTVNEKCR